ncbi:MAG: hypothetical protein HWN68_06985 [Desulfobacterales bacterium]|nr:hypothetical protein [Desulfobacterales bacterium]
MIPKDGMDLQYLREAFVRRFWYVVLTFFVVSMATIIYCIKAPRIYESNTLILVQPQEVPRDYVRPTVTMDARSRLNTLSEQVMSRPRLEEIITKHSLYPKVRAAGTMYDAVETMRKHISVEVKETRRRRDTAPASFEITYEGQSPVKVRNVTAAIANLFIDDNLKLREQQAAGTSKFLKRELERMREHLRRKEDLVREFKEKYIGLLPEQMENNYRILAQLQQHLDSLNSTLQQTEDRKVLLQTQSARLKTLRAGGWQGEDNIATPPDDLSQFSLEELRRQLQGLKSRYSDKHPDVLRLSAAIDKLEDEREAAVGDTDSQMSGAGSRPGEAQRLVLAQREDLLAQSALVEKQIQKLTEEKMQTGRQIEKYRERIENGPKIEQMFVDLRRDYKEASENYQSLLKKKLQAELAENLERTQKGEQFTVLNPANLPQKPVKPDILKILSMGLMLALACGLGLAFLREYTDRTFWSSKELESIVGLPVLVSVPVVNTDTEHRRNLLKRAGAVGATASMACVLVYALLVLWKTDPMMFMPLP